MAFSDIALEVKRLSDATSAKIGQVYFEALVEYLSGVLEVDIVLIGELVESNTAIQTKAVFSNGERADNIVYQLSGTPCETVVCNDACVISKDAQLAFPEDLLLQHMNVEGYVGVPLFSVEGAPFGLIIALNSQPIQNEDFILTYFDLVTGRIAAEYERLQIMKLLTDQEKKFRDIAYCSSDIIWEVNEHLEYSFSSTIPEGILGYLPEELIGRKPFDFMPEKESQRVQALFKPVWDNRETFSALENLSIHKDGSLVYLETSGVPIFDAKGEFRGYRGLDRNITERKEKERELQLAATVLETATEAVMVTDVDKKIIKVNKAFTEITGYQRDEVLGKTPAVLTSGHHDGAFYVEMFKTLELTGKWESEIWNRKKNGSIYPQWLSVSAMYDEQGDLNGYVALFSDITKRKEYEEKIEYQANYDALTGLANRHLLKDRFASAIYRSDRNNSLVSLLFIDLDRFKQVNDSFGHTFGDRLLKQVGKRISGHVRQSDTVARLGGDEFAVIFPDLPDTHHMEDTIRTILNTLAQPYHIDKNDVYLSASIGITVYPEDGNTIEELLRNADSAMYKAKNSGRNTFQYYSADMHLEAQQRIELENALRKAAVRQEFVLHYQPVIDARTNCIVGAEALIRWQRPDVGLVYPNDFIGLAEECGLITVMGEWVLQEACSQIAHILDSCPDDFFVSVNVSCDQFKNGNMPALVAGTLQATGLAPHRLVLEITESIMLNDDCLILEQFEKLRRLGIGISIDDFGTGYSSLSYLHKYPITTLKIDRSFVNELSSDNHGHALVTAILAMSDSLGLKVIAEGIEQESQAGILAKEGCMYFQGYLYSKPLAFEAFQQLVSDSHSISDG